MKSFYFIIPLLILQSCKKDTQFYDNSTVTISLPPYSETGANIFAFLMNDSVFTVFGATYGGTIFSPAAWHANTIVFGHGYTGTPDRFVCSISGTLSIIRQNETQKEITATISFYPDLNSPLKTYLLSGLDSGLANDHGPIELDQEFRSVVFAANNPIARRGQIPAVHASLWVRKSGRFW